MSRGRRDAIDVARVLALVIVVLGHLVLAVVDRSDGKLRGANLLELHPGWAWLAAAAPMPVFFGAAGWANATATLEHTVVRLRRLVGLGAMVVAVWSSAVIIVTIANGDSGITGDGARIATQPLWFLAAYVPFAAAGRSLAWLARRHIGALIGGALLVLASLDVARFGYDAPEWLGWPGFFLAWGTPWLLGSWWRSRHEGGEFDERRVGLALVAGACVVAVVLVATAGYEPALIDAVPGARSNTTPPTLYTAVAAIAQFGLLMIGAAALDRVGRRWRSLWDRAGEAAIGIYVWHLTALALCLAIVAAGVPVPTRLTVVWWLTRPLWWALVLAVTAALVAASSVVPRRRGGVVGRWPALACVVLTAAGAGYVGLHGPRSVPAAITCTLLFTGGWLASSKGRRSWSVGPGDSPHGALVERSSG